MSDIDNKPERNAPSVEQMIADADVDHVAAKTGTVAWFTRMANDAERLWLFRQGEHDIGYYEFAARLRYDKRNANKLWRLGPFRDDALEWLKMLMLKAEIDTGRKPNAGAGFVAPSMAKTLRYFCPPHEDDYDDDLKQTAVKAAMLAVAHRPAEQEQEMVSISRAELEALRRPAAPGSLDQELERVIDGLVPAPVSLTAATPAPGTPARDPHRPGRKPKGQEPRDGLTSKERWLQKRSAERAATRAAKSAAA
jgi:hypothetical protein